MFYMSILYVFKQIVTRKIESSRGQDRSLVLRTAVDQRSSQRELVNRDFRPQDPKVADA